MLPRDWRARLLFIVLLGWSNPNAASAQAFPTHSIKEAINLYPGATCLELGRLTDAVQRILSTDAIDARIRVEVRGDWRAPNVVSITIWRVAQAYATRRFDDAPADCAELHSLVGLAIAFAIDATWLAKGKKEKKVDVAPPVAKTPTLVQRLALGADAAISGGVVAGLGMGASLRLELRALSWLDLRSSVLGVFSLKQPLGAGNVDLILTAARVDACGGMPLQPRFAMRACLGAAIGGLTTHGRNFTPSMTDTTLWLAVVGGVDGLWTVSEHIKLVVAIDGVIPIGRHIVQVLDLKKNEPVGDSLTLNRVAVMGRIGPLFSFY
jgi:hypothetical protein